MKPLVGTSLVAFALAALAVGCMKADPLPGRQDASTDTDADGDTDADTDGDTDTDTDSDADTDTDTDTDTDGDTDPPTNCTGLDDFTLCYVDTTATEGVDRSYDICVDEVCVSPGCGTADCNTPGPHFPLADSNQRSCYDLAGAISPPSPGAGYYGQDAQYGWDTTHAADARFTRDTTTSSDNPLVTDNVTDLMWQGCEGFLNGASCGSGTAATFTWANALVYCDELEWGGYADWRLPDIYELISIMDLGTCSPAIDTAAFPATASGHFWSSTSNICDESSAAVGAFDIGSQYSNPKSDPISVRCVRGDPMPHASRFVRDTFASGYPTVADSWTGLEWQGCQNGHWGDDCTSGSDQTLEWAGALAYCEGLSWAGHDDWRLPSLKELLSVVEYGVTDPSIDEAAFPNTSSAYFWNSTTAAYDVSGTWGSHFLCGGAGGVEKTGEVVGYARCVRGG